MLSGWLYSVPGQEWASVSPVAEVELEEAFRARNKTVRVALEDGDPPCNVDLDHMKPQGGGKLWRNIVDTTEEWHAAFDEPDDSWTVKLADHAASILALGASVGREYVTYVHNDRLYTVHMPSRSCRSPTHCYMLQVQEPPSAPAKVVLPPCPITTTPIVDPVIGIDGHMYEKTALQRWFVEKRTSPITNQYMIPVVASAARLIAAFVVPPMDVEDAKDKWFGKRPRASDEDDDEISQRL